MTLVEVVTALLMFGLGCTVFTWTWSTGLEELAQGHTISKLNECLDDGAETITTGHQAGGLSATQSQGCRLNSTVTWTQGVKWVRVAAEFKGESSQLWLRQ
jgi:hypothetical protein